MTRSCGTYTLDCDTLGVADVVAVLTNSSGIAFLGHMHLLFFFFPFLFSLLPIPSHLSIPHNLVGVHCRSQVVDQLGLH